MKTLSTNTEAAILKKTEISGLLNQAIEHHKQCEIARASVRERQQVALWHAWQVGIRLNRMKALIPRGDWTDWLELNFCRPIRISVRTAQVYMKIDRNNPELREAAETQRVASTEPDFQILTKLKLDTIRSHAYSYMPEKPRPNKHLDVKLQRLYSVGTLVNEYCRIRNRHVAGLNKVDFAFFRKETGELYRFLQFVHEDSNENPWDSYAHPAWRIRAMRKRQSMPRENRLLELPAAAL